ncbi:MAG: transglutaminase-like cysteine peptidase [Phenylobacterium sp.]
MSSINSQAGRLLTLGATLAAMVCLSTPAQADPKAVPPMMLGAASGPPRGFVEFCRRQPADCGATDQELAAIGGAVATSGSATAASSSAAPATSVSPFDWAAAFAEAKARRQLAATPVPAAAAMPMTRDLWAALNITNSSINRAIVSKADAETYGVSDLWATPLAFGRTLGDCEDYVLEKRRALLAIGLRPEALSIAVVITTRGQTHAVLLVNTDKGEYVLDNLSGWVLPWTETSYQWRERQVAGSASHWAMPVGPVTEPQPKFLLASLH